MRTLVLLSGGLDSTVATWWARAQGWEVTAITFLYDGRAPPEIERTRAIARRAGIELVEVELPWMREADGPRHPLWANPRLARAEEGYIPARNAIFYATAAYYAELLGAERIIGGHNGVDPEAFPDSAGSFFDALSRLLREGLASGSPLDIIQPLLGQGKDGVLRLGLKLGAPIELSWSCYGHGPEPCGRCRSCVERAQGFKAIGREDPALDRADPRPLQRTPGNREDVELRKASIGFLTVWVAHLGRRFGLLQTLASHPRGLPAGDLARETRLDPATVDVWLRAAHALYVVEREEDRFTLPPRLWELLANEEHPDYLCGQFSYLALRSLSFADFDDLFCDGRAAGLAGVHLAEAFSEATRWDHTAFLELLLPARPALASSLEAGARVLDVGCGTGEWALRVAERFPRSRVRGLDPDARAVEEARRSASARGLADRTHFDVGRGEDLKEVSAFDIIHLGEVLYLVEPRTAILSAAHRALRPGGILVVAEGLLEDDADPRTPTGQLLHGMQLDFALQGARLLSRSELESVLTTAGFQALEWFDAGGGLFFATALR